MFLLPLATVIATLNVAASFSAATFFAETEGVKEAYMILGIVNVIFGIANLLAVIKMVAL